MKNRIRHVQSNVNLRIGRAHAGACSSICPRAAASGLLALTLGFVAVAGTSASEGVEPTLSKLGNLPLSFERNVGQIDPAVRFIAHTPTVVFSFTPSEVIFGEVQMKIINGNPAPEIAGIDLLPGRSNYFIGNDPTKWKTDVPHYARVRYAEVYQGIDLIFHGNQRQLEYDFVVAPHSDPRRIRVAFDGALQLRIDRDGALIVRTNSGNEIRQHPPVIYQEVDGARRKVAGGY